MISNRVAADLTGHVAAGTPLGTTKELEFIIQPTRKGRYRVYDLLTEYSTTSGGYLKRGKVQRDVDDRPFEFSTQQAAEQWLADGLPVALF